MFQPAMLRELSRCASSGAIARNGIRPFAPWYRGYRQIAAAASSTSGPWVSDELVSKLSDKELLKTQGYVGGEWIQANDSSTFEVTRHCTLVLIGSCAKLFGVDGACEA